MGHRVVLDSPDSGRTEYRYDLGGNLGSLITANLEDEGKQIRYLYTFNRLDKIDYPEMTDVNYSYGAPGETFNRAGKLVTLEDESGIEELYYGKLGEVVRSSKTFVS